MKDQLISFETAKLAKEKEFIEGSKNYYNGVGEIKSFNPEFSQYATHKNNFMQRFLYEAPTQSLLRKWLRETYNIHLVIKPFWNSKLTLITYACDIAISGQKPISRKRMIQSTYEASLEDGLQEALKLINNE